MMWWRRKGFGVHSPFAFSLITRTIAERGEYYVYPELRYLTGKNFRRFSLLFRLICRFKPSSVKIFSSDPKFESTIRFADSHIVFNNADPEMIVTDNLSSETEAIDIFNILSSSGKRPSFIVIFNINRVHNRTLWSLINSETNPLGMTFTDGCTAIICLSSNLPHQSYRLLF